MAFKLIIALALCATVANAAQIFHAPLAYSYAAGTPLTYADSAIGSTQENVVRSIGGTVSHYSKAVDTPFSSVRKSDTRINNNVYTPALAKTITYAAAPAAPAFYAHAAAPAVYDAQHAAPVVVAPARAAIAYSPAANVAHVTFDGFGAHYVY